MFLSVKDNLFQLQHNLQYYIYSIKRGSPKILVNYNKDVTCALYHFANDNPEESALQLSKLTKVTHLEEQLKEYSQFAVLEMKN